MLQHLFYLLTLMALSTVAKADIYADARVILSSNLREQIIRLSPDTQAHLQAYFDEINALLDYPGEQRMPIRVVLVAPAEDDFAAFVVRSAPGYVFWNPYFILSSIPGDVELHVMAHE